LLIFALASCKMVPKLKTVGRVVSSEPTLLKIEYRGTCQQFNQIIGGITVNPIITGSTTVTAGCLPIDAGTNGAPDFNTLTGHFVCTDVAPRRAIIDVTEVFSTAADTDLGVHLSTSEYDTIPFILGITSNEPFRTLAASYFRRPDCRTTTRFCDSTSQDVVSCRANNVVTQRGWVLNKDTVYVVPNAYTAPYVCADPSLTCCSYIQPVIANTVPSPSFGFGICGPTDTTNNNLFTLEEPRPAHHEEHRPQHNEEHRPQEYHEEHRPQEQHEEHRPQEHHEEHRPQEHHEEHRPQHYEEHRPQEHHEEHHENDDDDKKRSL